MQLYLIFPLFISIIFSSLPVDALGTFEGDLTKEKEKYKITISSLANGIDFSVINKDGKEINESSVYEVISNNPDHIIEFPFRSKINIKLTFIPLLNNAQWEMELGPKIILLKKIKTNDDLLNIALNEDVVSSADMYQFCPNDGFPNTGGKFTFCPKCGSSLKSDVVPESNVNTANKLDDVANDLFNLEDAIVTSPIESINSKIENSGKLVQPPKEIPEKYCIQIASKPALNEARALRREIYDKKIIDMNSKQGFGVYIDEVITEKDFFWYRVRIQPYTDKQFAVNDKNKLAIHYGDDIWVDFVRQLPD